MVFWSKRRHQKDILKLTDLYQQRRQSHSTLSFWSCQATRSFVKWHALGTRLPRCKAFSILSSFLFNFITGRWLFIKERPLSLSKMSLFSCGSYEKVVEFLSLLFFCPVSLKVCFCNFSHLLWETVVPVLITYFPVKEGFKIVPKKRLKFEARD